MHEWMTDAGHTPHLVVDVAVDGVTVPDQHVNDGKIILNVSWTATEGLDLGNEHISFSARFGGKSHDVVLPVSAVMGIYARETGQGMIFSDEAGPPPPKNSTTEKNGPGNKRPQLKIVK